MLRLARSCSKPSPPLRPTYEKPTDANTDNVYEVTSAGLRRACEDRP